MARRGGGDFDRMTQSMGPIFKNLGGRFGKFGIGSIIFLIVAVAALIWLATGIYTVDQGQLAAVKRFGKLVSIAQPGIHWRIPTPIETVTKVNVQERRSLELGFRTIDPGPPATIQPFPVEAIIITGDTNLVDVQIVVQWRVTPAVVPDPRDPNKQIEGIAAFLYNVADPEGDPGQRTLRDAAEAALRKVVGQNTIDDILGEQRAQIEEDIKAELQSIMDAYKAGILIELVQIRDAKPPSQVKPAFDDVVAAGQDKERLINEAQAYERDIVPRAQGEGDKMILDARGFQASRTAEAQGEAQKFIAILKEYVVAPEVTRTRLYLETIENVLANIRKVILSGASSEVLPLLPLGEETVSTTQQGAAAESNQ
ncbi:MAG: FtsH protease activity modulator HflK [Dehalococcoidia bacterium]